ncbi:hypothetical protein GCK72_008024 [Caenorhabditis remanei]|uniref:F-box associated domain-containing protein n=1 Tax=Caenorhabditis remanei TaxID=31234 RepID=A0A6A5HNZ4_CAERE|nr:hypothetical protein GCK72_008024 [Caenorhabditis remanei]KAF1768063.1 hypothetical protein GCK72_008024 [Caenorhabditis remanei]
MPVGLSYLGLRCVLEHLDAVKRIHIASRCAVLRRCEKSIPLRLNYLCIGSELRLDYCLIWLSYEMELEFNDTRRTRVYTRDEPRSVLHAVSVSQNLDHQTANEKINQYYMGGRTSVYVKRLDIFGSASSLSWSVDSMFKITELNAEDNYFEDFLPIIDPISFPLKSLQTKTAGLHTYDHPVFRSAEALSFNLFEEHSEAEIICLHKLPCKTILFEYDLEWINIVRMIRYWMENPKEIGTKYTFVEYGRKLVYNVVNCTMLCIH